MGKLTARKVQSIIKEGKPGKFSDGGGLYVVMPKSGTAYWMARYTIYGKRKEMKLGKVGHVSLADVRAIAAKVGKDVSDGQDPLAARQREQRHPIQTVDHLYVDWIAEVERRVKNPQIPKRIYKNEIAPFICDLLVSDVDSLYVKSIIERVRLSGRPSICNDTLMYLKQLFNHGMKLGVLVNNPAAPFTVNDAGGVEKSRDRALSRQEVAKAFKVFRDHNPYMVSPRFAR